MPKASLWVKRPDKDLIDRALAVLGEVKTMIHEGRFLLPAISSVCFYTHPPARPRRNRLPHNSKAGALASYLKPVVN